MFVGQLCGQQTRHNDWAKVDSESVRILGQGRKPSTRGAPSGALCLSIRSAVFGRVEFGGLPRSVDAEDQSNQHRDGKRERQ